MPARVANPGPTGALRTFALVAVTVAWGGTFVLVKDAIRTLPPVSFLAVRFTIAALVMALLLVLPGVRRQWRSVPPRALVGGGLAVGLALAAGYILQTLGLARTSAADAGLLTGLLVILTPLLGWPLQRRRPLGVTLAASGLCLLGTVFLEGGIPPGARLGDLLVVGCAIAFAIHILLLGRYSPRLAPVPLATSQLGVAAVAFLLLSPAEGSIHPAAVLAVWPALLITSLFASAGGFLVQTWAQGVVAPNRVAVILATEPVFAVLFAFILAGERYATLQWLGAALVLLALLGHEVFLARAGSTGH